VRRLSLAVGLMWMAAVHAGPTPITQTEINYLLAAVAASECRFYRNGTWYSAKLAAEHLRDKYNALLARDLIRDTDDFIERAATKSSVSGAAYAIKCGDAEVSSHQWLVKVLAEYRQTYPPQETGPP